jgi:hypothetical protein
MISIISLILIVPLTLGVLSLLSMMIAPSISKHLGLEPVPAFIFSAVIIVLVVAVEEWIRR